VWTYAILSQAPFIDELNEWMSGGDCFGFFFYPKQSSDVRKVEIAKSLKLTKDSIIPVPWTVPRKRLEFFQDDLFPPTRVPLLMSADEFFAGVTKEPTKISLKPADMTELSKAPQEELTDRQKKYQQRLIDEEQKAKAPKVRGATGHTNAQEVREHFTKVATTLPTRNRWDAPQDNSQVDVDEGEWK